MDRTVMGVQIKKINNNLRDRTKVRDRQAQKWSYASHNARQIKCFNTAMQTMEGQ